MPAPATAATETAVIDSPTGVIAVTARDDAIVGVFWARPDTQADIRIDAYHLTAGSRQRCCQVRRRGGLAYAALA